MPQAKVGQSSQSSCILGEQAALTAAVLLHKDLLPDHSYLGAGLNQLPVLDAELMELGLHLQLLVGCSFELLLQLLQGAGEVGQGASYGFIQMNMILSHVVHVIGFTIQS